MVENLENATRIGDYSFTGNIPASFDSLNLPYCTYVGRYGLNFNIKKLILGSIESISSRITTSDNTYGKMSTLEHIECGDTLTDIGSVGLNGYSKLQQIILHSSTPPTLASTSAFNNTNNCPIYVPDVSVEAYKQATNWSAYADRIMSMFYYLGYIDFADPNVLQVLLDAGYDTDADGKISIEEAAAVTDINNVFANNNNITTFNEFKYFTGITDTTKMSYIFWGCKNLREITLPESITHIRRAFFYNTVITELTIPKNVVYANEIFENCNTIKKVIIETNYNWTNDAFAWSSIEQYVLSPNVTNYIEKDRCIYSSDGSTFIGIPAKANLPSSWADGVTSLSKYCFYRNNLIDSIVIPESTVVINGFQKASIRKVRIDSVFTNVQMPFADSVVKIVDITKNNTITPSLFSYARQLKTLLLTENNVYPLSGAFGNNPIAWNSGGYIYVPDDLVDSYKAADNWSTYANQIKPINVVDTLPDISTVAENDLYKVGDVYWKAELVDEVLTWVEI